MTSVAESPSQYHTGTTQHRLMLPLHLEPNYSYPLIVWLHSAGDDASQLLRVMPSVSLRNYCGVAPQGPQGCDARGYYWPQDPRGIEDSQRAVCEAIDYASMKVAVASHRIYLAGYGAGGTMAFRLALRLVDRVAGCISLNGPLPAGFNPLGDLKRCRQMPLLWIHCQKSAEFREDSLCEQLKLLHIGGFNVTVRQYPFGDELPELALRDTNRWIMEQSPSSVF